MKLSNQSPFFLNLRGDSRDGGNSESKSISKLMETVISSLTRTHWGRFSQPCFFEGSAHALHCLHSVLLQLRHLHNNNNNN